jgi:1,4-dihydroxy-6-naphthoate synthase
MEHSHITIGFSPCPNDCFIFDAMVHGKIDTEGLQFNVVMEDVEALNKRAFNGELDVTKLSFHAFLHLTNEYVLLNSGSALGFNCGPLLIAKNQDLSIGKETKIAIPGKYTTANFLLSLAYPDAQNKIPMLFSEIEVAVLDGAVDAGLIIHENRFTYEQKGLKKIIDLGEFWEGLIHAPIPLGGIVGHRRLRKDILLKVDRVIKRSVEYAFTHPDSSSDFVRKHAQEMDEAVMKRHIDLYVNEYSAELGDLGRNAVQLMIEKAKEIKLVSDINSEIFVS